MAEGEAERAYMERDRLVQLLAADTRTLNGGFAAEGRHADDGNQQWREKFAPSYGIEDPCSWFAGYDRCNI